MDEDNKCRAHKSMSREEFKSRFDERHSGSLELYDKVPSCIKALNNFDPTGISSYLLDILDGKQAELDKEKNLEVMYNFYLAINWLNDKIDGIDSQIDTRTIELTRAYFYYSRIAFHKELIIHFRYLWCNSINNIEDSSEEQVFMFNMLSSLTLDNIKILKLVYNSYKSDTREGLKVGQRGVSSVEAISSKLGFSNDYSKTLCLSLVGKGLLIDANVNPFGDRANLFSINNYFDKFLKYVLQEP